MPPTKNQNGSERRQAERAAASFALSFGPPGKRERAQLRDISTLGLCCESPAAVAEMTQLRIDLEVPGAAASFQTEGVVVRCDKIAGLPAGKYELAVYFTALDPTHKRWIADYVARTKAAASPNFPDRGSQA